MWTAGSRAQQSWCSGLVAPWHGGIFLDQGLNLCLLHCQADSLPLSHQGSLKELLCVQEDARGLSEARVLFPSLPCSHTHQGRLWIPDLGDSPPPRPHCTLKPGNAPSAALWNFPEWGALRPGAQVGILWGTAVHSLALNHTGRKFIPSLPIFPTGSRRASQLGATIPLTLNTFPSVLFKEERGSWQEQQHQASAQDLCFITALRAYRFLLRQHATLALPWVVIGSLPHELGKK